MKELSSRREECYKGFICTECTMTLGCGTSRRDVFGVCVCVCMQTYMYLHMCVLGELFLM